MTIDTAIERHRKLASYIDEVGDGSGFREVADMLEELKWYRSQNLVDRDAIINYIKAVYVVGEDCPFPSDRCSEWQSYGEDCRDCLIHHLEQIPKAEPDNIVKVNEMTGDCETCNNYGEELTQIIE